jgi:hypothetical protein
VFAAGPVISAAVLETTPRNSNHVSASLEPERRAARPTSAENAPFACNKLESHGNKSALLPPGHMAKQTRSGIATKQPN